MSSARAIGMTNIGGSKPTGSMPGACWGPWIVIFAGNPHALCVVRVPTIEQERRRSQSRIREGLLRDLKAIAQRGRSLALQYGYSLKGDWFGPRRWPHLLVPDWLRELLAPLRHSRLAWLWEEVQRLTQQLEAASAMPKPIGVGGLTEQVLQREMGAGAGSRTAARWPALPGRAPAGTVPAAVNTRAASPKRQRPRALDPLQTVWRLLRYQPDYWLIKKWKSPAGRSPVPPPPAQTNHHRSSPGPSPSTGGAGAPARPPRPNWAL